MENVISIPGKKSRAALALLLLLFIFPSLIFAQEPAKRDPGEKKFQIQIEDEIEQGVSEDQNETENEEIIVSGEDEQLIRTFKSDTTFIPPTDASSIRWIEDKTQIDKDGKRNRKKTNEKNGDIIAAYGLYDNSFLNVNIAKSDKFGLYQLRYIRNNAVTEGFDGKDFANSFHSSDDVRVSIGSRLLPTYTLLFDAGYRGDYAGYQNNPQYSDIFRRLGNFRFQNQLKPDEHQILNIDLIGNYLQSRYYTTSNSTLKPLYLSAASDLQWLYIFDSKFSLEALGHYDFLYLKDMTENEAKASTAHLQGLLHIPIVRSSLGPSGGTSWQLNATIGGGGFYRDAFDILPTGRLVIDSKLDIWKSLLVVERAIRTISIDESPMNSIYEKPVFYSQPETYWNYYWENGFSFNKENILRARLGFKQYDVYYNTVLDSTNFYYKTPVAYDELYARVGWEYTFLRNFLIQTGLDINFGLTQVNMRPLYSFLVAINYNTDRFDTTISFKGVGKRLLDSITIKDYYLLNASIRFWINPSFALMASGENLLNMQYTEYYPYQDSGIKIFAGCYIKI